ncbi:hypothetical protein HYT52_04620 [Candidatus Woesearchaeota archaeon]|nr:hypothetical protein [Candidatus Woesearchaeota archaeon]
MQKQDHSPTLNTILMVENLLKNSKKALNIAEIKRKLPKKVHHYTLKTVLSYLEESKKISFSLDGVAWRFSDGN